MSKSVKERKEHKQSAQLQWGIFKKTKNDRMVLQARYKELQSNLQKEECNNYLLILHTLKSLLKLEKKRCQRKNVDVFNQSDLAGIHFFKKPMQDYENCTNEILASIKNFETDSKKTIQDLRKECYQLCRKHFSKLFNKSIVLSSHDNIDNQLMQEVLIDDGWFSTKRIKPTLAQYIILELEKTARMDPLGNLENFAEILRIMDVLAAKIANDTISSLKRAHPENQISKLILKPEENEEAGKAKKEGISMTSLGSS